MEGYENSVDFPLYEHQLEAVNGVDDIYSAMMELINDSAKRNYLVQNGYNNALQYTWERGAEELHDVLMKLK